MYFNTDNVWKKCAALGFIIFFVFVFIYNDVTSTDYSNWLSISKGNISSKSLPQTATVSLKQSPTITSTASQPSSTGNLNQTGNIASTSTLQTTTTTLAEVPTTTTISTPAPPSEPGYLTLTGNTGRLGNQIWFLTGGWAIAKALGRKFYVYSTPVYTPVFLTTNAGILQRILDILEMFPKLKKEIEIKNKFDVIVPHNYENGQRSCCAYEDPQKLANRTEEYLVLDAPYVQNYLYLEKYENELRDLLQCSDKLKSRIEDIREKFEINSTLMCAHVRRTDFISVNIAVGTEQEAHIIEYAANRTGNPRLLLFSDSLTYSNSLIKSLADRNIISADSFASPFSPEEDLCIAATLCTWTVLTNQSSSFGFWLAFLNSNHSNVYYPDEPLDKKVLYFHNLTLPWNAVPLEEKTKKNSTSAFSTILKATGLF